jgi:hypothetical protein
MEEKATKTKTHRRAQANLGRAYLEYTEREGMMWKI